MIYVIGVKYTDGQREDTEYFEIDALSFDEARMMATEEYRQFMLGEGIAFMPDALDVFLSFGPYIKWTDKARELALKVANRSKRMRRLVDLNAPLPITLNEMRMLSGALAELIENLE